MNGSKFVILSNFFFRNSAFYFKGGQIKKLPYLFRPIIIFYHAIGNHGS